MGERGLPVLHTVEEVVALVARSEEVVHVHFGHPDHSGPSCDHESGLLLPGLSVNPLTPPRWWRDRPLADWVVRQICTYAHLEEGRRACLIVTGEIADRGPDNEPLLAAPTFLAAVAPEVVLACRERHERSRRPQDRPASSGAAPWQSPA